MVVVLSDINMPGMSGLDLLSAIREEFPDLQVYMVTAYDDGKLKTTALRAARAATSPSPSISGPSRARCSGSRRRSRDRLADRVARREPRCAGGGRGGPYLNEHMDIGIVGLGRMGLNIALRLLRDGHRVVVNNRSPEPVAVAVEAGAEEADTVADFAHLLSGPRVVWVMLPAGDVTDTHVDEVLAALGAGDVVVEGSNGKWTDALAQAERARQRGVGFVDVGVSGGVWGLENGFSLMAGGDERDVALVEPAFRSLAPTPETGWGRVGPVGSGHFVKMVHNGVEYGMMQAFAEGFAIMEAQRLWGERDGEPVEHALDLGAVAEVWRTGSVVQSWLLDLAAEVLQARPALDGIAPVVPDSGEGRWTVDAAVALRVPAPVIAAALFQRFASQDTAGFGDRMLSALRGQFGGHPVAGDPGAGGTFADQIHDDGTIDVVPGGVQTEGASTRPI